MSQCKAIIHAGLATLYCVQEESHEGSHEFRVPDEDAEQINRAHAALLKVKEWVDDDGWCPICDEHHCRSGNCVLAELGRRGSP
jgi:hypothetical protein